MVKSNRGRVVGFLGACTASILLAACGTSASSPTTTGATTTVVPALATCTTAVLSASLANDQGAAGTFSYVLTLTNRGATTCRTEGYPGVSLINAMGHLIGIPATRVPKRISSITLAPSQRAHATIFITDSGAVCDHATVANSLRVYPPDQTTSLVIPVAYMDYCVGYTAQSFSVTPLSPSS